jgi:tRNA threonylcarbamoyladenosine biosynthesis protein TsaE
MFPIQYSLTTIDIAAAELISYIKQQQITCVTLQGQMGAGKTTLVKALCKVMGITQGVSSPTYAIINEYSGNNNTVLHMDLYRLQHISELIDAGVEDALFTNTLCFVEWPNIAEAILPTNRLDLQINTIDADKRIIDKALNMVQLS